MTVNYRDNRADRATGDDADVSADESTGGHRTSSHLRGERHCEWRQWIIRLGSDADYGVVPVDRLVEMVVEREPDADRAAVRRGLRETVLPSVTAAGTVDYDAATETVIYHGG